MVSGALVKCQSWQREQSAPEPPALNPAVMLAEAWHASVAVQPALARRGTRSTALRVPPTAPWQPLPESAHPASDPAVSARLGCSRSQPCSRGRRRGWTSSCPCGSRPEPVPQDFGVGLTPAWDASWQPAIVQPFAVPLTSDLCSAWRSVVAWQPVVAQVPAPPASVPVTAGAVVAVLLEAGQGAGGVARRRRSFAGQFAVTIPCTARFALWHSEQVTEPPGDVLVRCCAARRACRGGSPRRSRCRCRPRSPWWSS